MDTSIQLFLAILLINTVQADPVNEEPQTLEANAPQYAQRFKEVVMYLTPTQIRNYEAGHGLPNLLQTAYSYEQQKPESQKLLNEQEGQIIHSTLDILEANKMRFQHEQPNNADLEFHKAHVQQSSDIKPIEEPNTEAPLAHPQVSIGSQEQERETHKLREQALKEQEKSIKEQEQAKSYAYLQFFSNKKAENQEKIQVFHPEPHNANLNKEIRLPNEQNIEIQQDSLLRQKFKLIPYEYVAEENQEIHQQVREQVAKQENKALLQLFIPASPQHQDIKDNQKLLNGVVSQQYAPQFTSQNKNIHLEKILQEIQLEREAAKIHAENIANSPAVVIHKDISIIRRRPIHVIKHVNIPYPAPFLVPVPNPVEVKVPQPYAVPKEIVRHVPVPIVKTEVVEVEKPVPYEVEKRVAEFFEKKVYVPVDKPYTVERIVPVEVKKEIPVPIAIHRPQKFTIIRHVWKH